jgi:hypothetical protein
VNLLLFYFVFFVLFVVNPNERIVMRTSNALTVILLCGALAAPVFAENAPAQGGQQGGSSSTAPSDAIYLDPTPFIQEVDTDKDGKVSKSEWVASGLTEELYSRFDKAGTGYLTKEGLAAMYHPPTMDANEDGKFALSEIKAHIAKQSGGKQGGQSK